MADVAASGQSGKVVIRNIGLLLSGDLDRPILDADTVVVQDGLITAVGKEADCDTTQPTAYAVGCAIATMTTRRRPLRAVSADRI